MEKRIYETTHLVEYRDLNHHGTLFAAVMAGWFVEMGFIAASSALGDTAGLMCVAVNNMRFSHPVSVGSLVRMTGEVKSAGNTSLTIGVKAMDVAKDLLIVEGETVFVSIDPDTRTKRPHGITL